MSINIDNRTSFSHHNMMNRIELFRKKLSSMNIDIMKVKGLSSAAMYGYRTKGNVPKGDSLEEWGTRFGLNINWLLWGEGEMLVSEAAKATPAISDKENQLLWENRDLRMEIDRLKTELEAAKAVYGDASTPTAGAIVTRAPGTPSAAPTLPRETE